MRQWIITAGGDAVPIDDLDLVGFAIARPGLFGLTPDDCAVVRQKIAENAPDIWHVFMSRILMVGIAVECSMELVGPTGEPVMAPAANGQPRRVARRGWRHMGSMSPPSPLENGKSLKDEDDPTMAIFLDDGAVAVFFHRESYPMWTRLIKWLERSPVELGINGHTVVTLKEWDTQRGWSHEVATIFRDYWKSKNPERGGKCNRCGHMVSWNEMIHGVDTSGIALCPKCGMPLA